MDIAGMAGASAAMAGAEAGEEVGVKMLDKSNDMAKDQASQLLESLPDQKSPNAQGQGLNVDVSA